MQGCALRRGGRGPGAEAAAGDVCTPTIIPWSHNTVAMESHHSVAAEKWQIWHIGDGVVDPSGFAPCFNSSEVGAPQQQPDDEGQAAPPSPGAEVFVSTSASPNGPFVRGLNNAPLPIKYSSAPGAWPQSATNPSPLELPDGRLALFFTAVRPCSAPGARPAHSRRTGPGQPIAARAVVRPRVELHRHGRVGERLEGPL